MSQRVKDESKPSTTVRANFVRVSDLQKSGSGIDYKNLFGHKKSTSPSTTSSSSSVTRTSSSSDKKEKKKSSRSTTSSSTTEKTEKKKAPAKRKYKSRNSEPVKKVEKGDKLKWITRKGKKYVSYNGKKYSGKKAFQIYKEWKEVNGEEASDVSDNEQSDEEYVPPKKKTKKESKEKKIEETKPKLKLKKKEVIDSQTNTIDKFFKKETKVETIEIESEDEIESFISDDEFEDEVVEIID